MHRILISMHIIFHIVAELIILRKVTYMYILNCGNLDYLATKQRIAPQIANKRNEMSFVYYQNCENMISQSYEDESTFIRFLGKTCAKNLKHLVRHS